MLDILNDIGKFAAKTVNQIGDGIKDIANEVGQFFEDGFNAVANFASSVVGSLFGKKNNHHVILIVMDLWL